MSAPHMPAAFAASQSDGVASPQRGTGGLSITGNLPGSRRHPVRTGFRVAWLGGELVLAALRFGADFLSPHSGPAANVRARWLHRCSRRFLRVFQVEIKVAGLIPTNGLLVCNHLSYLDILVLGALTPAVFVAKAEVRGWPILGWFARLAGTVFVQRERRSDVTRVNDELQAALESGAVVVLFPEGTSSGGHMVLPFKSSLLEPATQPGQRLWAGCIRYALEDGDPAEEVCYWRDMTLFPHLINLLSKRAITATVSLAEVHERSPCRKELARRLHSEVARLHEPSAF